MTPLAISVKNQPDKRKSRLKRLNRREARGNKKLLTASKAHQQGVWGELCMIFAINSSRHAHEKKKP